jgi:hypothetical protein
MEDNCKAGHLLYVRADLSVELRHATLILLKTGQDGIAQNQQVCTELVNGDSIRLFFWNEVAVLNWIRISTGVLGY